jgi:ABC-type phosphate transport system substrate-binding protein
MKNRFATWKGFALLLTGLMLGVGRVETARAQISIVVAKAAKLDSNDVKKAELKAIYTGNKLKWSNGNKIQVVDQAETGLGKKFYDLVLGKTLSQVRSQWTKLMLSGQASAPVQCSSDKAVKKIVASNPSAIGYIASSALDDSVKEILRIAAK